MPINAHPDYLAAEKEYLLAQTLKEKLKLLEKMISLAPSHKGAENLRAQLKTRYKKLKEKLEKTRPKKNYGTQGIKKGELQAVIIGFTNTGKSSLLNILTNTNPRIADYLFTTKKPLVGMIDYNGSKIQLVEIPSIESEYYDKGIVNNSDVILLMITEIKQIKQIKEELEKSKGKQIIVFNKSDLLNENEERKISATLQSKKYNFILISAKTGGNIKELKDKIFQSFGKIRIYTKEPKRNVNKERPLILEPNSTVKEVAEKILKGFSDTIKEIKIWGPSSKFPGQKIGLKHKLRDLDIIEFKTR